ncbi:hypothetical protein ACFQNF_01190 [Iodobacter arcticus]|uniref:DUF2489 domain-containing protein n=1 Tax=Iodobacter arcticus TaxID=590593 RepID=A0ABW2QSQ9_9NEIS
MCAIFSNPVLYILIVNIIGLTWAVRSWKKTIREKWMNSLRDAGAELIGAAELIYGIAADDKSLSTAQASFIAKEQKLLLLFAHDNEEKKIFKTNSENLRKAAEGRVTKTYRDELDSFSNGVSNRVLKEWQAIK